MSVIGVSGLNISLCPLYLAEISPKKIRGAIGTCHQLAITIGILFSQIMGLKELLGKLLQHSLQRLWACGHGDLARMLAGMM